MAGRKQHYIPQSLLRGFGKQGKGGKVQVIVYARDRGVFYSASDGVAAQRHFYSEPAAHGGSLTLDDKITHYETRLANTLAEFRATKPNHRVDAVKAAEVVAHLCIRNAHTRDSFASGAERVIDQVAGTFGDKDRLRQAMGLEDSVPTGPILDEINKLWGEYGSHFSQMGVTKQAFVQLAFGKVKDSFDQNFTEQQTVLKNMFGELRGRISEMARQGHNNALEKGPVPAAQVDALRSLAWGIEPGPATGLVLPDCVAIGSVRGKTCQALMYAGSKVDIVIMPLDHHRLLVGESDRGIAKLDLVNEEFAACSWDFFIARDRIPKLERLVSKIRERTVAELGDAIGAAEKDDLTSPQ